MALKATAWIIGIAIALVGWAWLAGYFYLELTGIDGVTPTPLTIGQYWYYYADHGQTATWIGLAGAGALVPVALPGLILLAPRKEKLHGDAKWAAEHEIRKAGLYSDEGIIVGQRKTPFGKKFLIFGGSQHVLMAAPTRSGKGISVVIPNLLTWKESVVVLDIKQENWGITSGFRAAHGQDCYLLNLAPRDYRTHRWNPLYYISDDPSFRINDIQKIGQMLFPQIQGEAPIWQASSRSLWLGLILYLIETDDLPVTMGEALRQLTMGDERLEEILEDRQEGDNPVSDECYLALREYLDTPDKTRGSVRKSFAAALELFYNPVIDAATSGNDFDLRDLRKKRMSVYIGITPDDLDRLAPLINLFYQQVIDLNTRELPEHNPDLKHQVLLLPDEFTAMGKVGILSKGISYIAGYGLRMLPIIQSPAQLREVYGADAAETFIENHALQIIFAPKNFKVAKEISETLGTKTTKSRSKSKQLTGKSGRSQNDSEASRELLKPQEVREIGANAEILLMENAKPIKAQKIAWFKEPLFIERGNGRDGIKWPNPDIPKVDPSTNKKGAIRFAGTRTETIERDLSADDIENIDKMDLSDFSCDFSDVEIPAGEIDDDKMDDLVSQFFGKLDGADEVAEDAA
ncbi:type IV secretory system conjugative DNA transfer family protein (plasmid) [Guyparkeria sp. 1SP6A2]|nr:type IV secretory system conjugative DNA transfer family protein [Guyparkeria sp. 1SP6A2]